MSRLPSDVNPPCALQIPVRVIAPAMVKSMMQTYFGIMRELAALGMGPFICPTSVNLFGFSYSVSQLKTRPGHATQAHRQFGGHSWSYDVALMRLIGLAHSERIAICTADDSNITTEKLRKRNNKSDGEPGSASRDSQDVGTNE
eukprot:scaffold2552_cov380-Prasinococcus_capsulatus_cf.AAC.28